MEAVHYQGPVPYHQAALVRPRRSRRGTFMLVVGVVAAVCVVGSLLILLGSALVKNAGSTVGGNETPTPTRAPTTKAPSPPGMGDAVRDGKFEFVVSNVQCGKKKVETGFFNQTAQGQFCIVDLSVSNVGTETQNFSELFQAAFDDSGTEYQADTAAGLIVNQGETVALWANVSPGRTITGKLVYDIPRKAEIVKLELHDSPFSQGVVVTL